MKYPFLLNGLIMCVLFSSCANQEGSGKAAKEDTTAATSTSAPMVSEEAVTYAANDVTFHGFVAYDKNKQGKRPAILVVPEWWGLNDYPRNRAKQLAEMGYIAMAVDMYGDG